MSDHRYQTARLPDFQPQDDELLAEVLQGLGRSPKQLPPKLFYDETGSQLFEQITQLPEYYLTRTEVGIMKQHAGEMVELAGKDVSLIEFGSGSSLKTRILLDHLQRPAAYVPVDISRDHLMEAAAALAHEFPDVEVLPVHADFTQTFKLPDPAIAPRRNLVYFPGSTIGNFELPEAVSLLKVIAGIAGFNGAALVGVDLRKDRDVLESAYNDSAGITAQFNLNLLSRINNELDADFDRAAFRHLAVYDHEAGRIEMRLVSLRHQTVNVAGESFEFEKNDFIVTEYSHKYDREEFEALADQAGLKVVRVWTDAEDLFSVQYLEVP